MECWEIAKQQATRDSTRNSSRKFVELAGNETNNPRWCHKILKSFALNAFFDLDLSVWASFVTAKQRRDHLISQLAAHRFFWTLNSKSFSIMRQIVTGISPKIFCLSLKHLQKHSAYKVSAVDCLENARANSHSSESSSRRTGKAFLWEDGQLWVNIINQERNFLTSCGQNNSDAGFQTATLAGGFLFQEKFDDENLPSCFVTAAVANHLIRRIEKYGANPHEFQLLSLLPREQCGPMTLSDNIMMAFQSFNLAGPWTLNNCSRQNLEASWRISDYWHTFSLTSRVVLCKKLYFNHAARCEAVNS